MNVLTSVQITHKNTIKCSDERKNEHKKQKRDAFKSKVIENRKVSLGNAIKGIDSFVKQEVSEARTLFNNHVQFYKDEKKEVNKKQNETVNVDVEILDADFFE